MADKRPKANNVYPDEEDVRDRGDHFPGTKSESYQNMNQGALLDTAAEQDSDAAKSRESSADIKEGALHFSAGDSDAEKEDIQPLISLSKRKRTKQEIVPPVQACQKGEDGPASVGEDATNSDTNAATDGSAHLKKKRNKAYPTSVLEDDAPIRSFAELSEYVKQYKARWRMNEALVRQLNSDGVDVTRLDLEFAPEELVLLKFGLGVRKAYKETEETYQKTVDSIRISSETAELTSQFKADKWRLTKTVKELGTNEDFQISPPKPANSPDSDSEVKHNKNKKIQKDVELEDGELEEDDKI